MGLLDIFRRKQPVPPDRLLDLYERVGSLQADQQTLAAQLAALRTEWSATHEQFTRLAQRLEKREQRAAKKGEQEPDDDEQLPFEVAAARALRARRGGSNGLLHGPGSR